MSRESYRGNAAFGWRVGFCRFRRSPRGISVFFALAAQATYNDRMEISFAPDLEAKLNRIASQSGKGPDEVVRELVASYLEPSYS